MRSRRARHSLLVPSATSAKGTVASHYEATQGKHGTTNAGEPCEATNSAPFIIIHLPPSRPAPPPSRSFPFPAPPTTRHLSISCSIAFATAWCLISVRGVCARSGIRFRFFARVSAEEPSVGCSRRVQNWMKKKPCKSYTYMRFPSPSVRLMILRCPL
jgi:hypothetical protein